MWGAVDATNNCVYKNNFQNIIYKQWQLLFPSLILLLIQSYSEPIGSLCFLLCPPMKTFMNIFLKSWKQETENPEHFRYKEKKKR